VKKIYEEYPSKKIIGICFGHQIIARALGGKVELNEKGWEMAVRQVNLAESAKKVFDLKRPVMVTFLRLYSGINGSDYNRCIEIS
jgi:GMP synthase-like glutamine amidotransferase